MPSSPRTEVKAAARLAAASALLWLACSERPQGGDKTLHREWLEPGTLQVMSSAQWSFTSSLPKIAREDHTATLLPSGKVLVTGGKNLDGHLASAELYDADTGMWTDTGSLALAREGHTATLLSSGRVLVTGGANASGLLASVEVYDPATGVWSPTGALATAREDHRATLLPSGKVLVTGGLGPSSRLASAELYDPATGAWASTSALVTARSGHTATLLRSGKVLVTGGSVPGAPLASAEVYDMIEGRWTSAGVLATAREGHTATLLPSGRVLVAGGRGPSGLLASAELYDPATGKWDTTGPLLEARDDHTATLLPSGKVLVTGGHGLSGSLSSAEVYDPATGTWTSTIALATARHGHAATLLPSGEVMVTGGSNSSGLLASAEAYEDTGAQEDWRPVITPSVQGPQQLSETLRITGSRFRGLSEASSGNVQSSATNFPLVSLLALEGGALTRATLPSSLSDTEVTVRTPLVPDGYYILSVMTNAMHGGQLVLVDGPPLEAPAVTSPEVVVNTKRPAIRGTAKQGSTAVVRLDGAVAGLSTTDAQGRWSFTPDTALAEGDHRVVAIARDEVGNLSPDSEERSFTVDTVPPGAPEVTRPGAFSNSRTPVIGGTTEPHSTVRVWLGDDEAQAVTVRADAAGDWRFVPATALEFGSHSVSATATDAAGNTSAQSMHGFAIQRSHYGWNCTTAPALPALWSLLALALSLCRRGQRHPGSSTTLEGVGRAPRVGAVSSVEVLAMKPGDPRTILAGTWGRGIYKTTTGGQ